MGLGTVFNALTNRRDPASGLAPPILKALAIALVPVALVVLATELPGLQRGLLTTSLTGRSGWPASGSRSCCRSSSRRASGSGAARRTLRRRRTGSRTDRGRRARG